MTTDKKYYWISDGDGQHSGYVEGEAGSTLEDAMEAWEDDMNPRGYEVPGHPWLNREGCREVSREEWAQSEEAWDNGWESRLDQCDTLTEKEVELECRWHDCYGLRDPEMLIDVMDEELEWELTLQEIQELCKREYPWSWSFTEFCKTHPVIQLYPTPGFVLFSIGWTAIIGGMIWMYVGILIRYGM